MNDLSVSVSTPAGAMSTPRPEAAATVRSEPLQAPAFRPFIPAEVVLPELTPLPLVAGTILGVIMSFGAQALIRGLVPASIQMAIVPYWWPIALGIMLASAALGAIYPGLSAARHDPIEALAYE